MNLLSNLFSSSNKSARHTRKSIAHVTVPEEILKDLSEARLAAALTIRSDSDTACTEESSSLEFSSKYASRKRKVHFEDNVRVRVFNIHQKPEDVWYTGAEMRELRAHAARKARDATDSEHKTNFMNIYNICGLQPEEDDSVKFFASTVRKTANDLARSEYRGFERYVLKNSTRRLRSELVASVLETQSRVPAAEREEAVATISRNQTKRSRRIACAIGFGDSVVASDLS